jgi:predicted enzyme related to lactoylglutathione lyase
MISGVHALIYSEDPVADRAFFREVLGLDSVDSGGGWLIFALPPAELAIHPAGNGGEHQLYLLCEDIEATARMLETKGVHLERPFKEERWGRVAMIPLPSGAELGVYQPKHPLAHPGGRSRAAETR